MEETEAVVIAVPIGQNLPPSKSNLNGYNELFNDIKTQKIDYEYE